MKTKGKLNDVDRHVGREVARRRRDLGMKQHDLARALGVTYQQVHKYEAGRNRMSAGRLHTVAEALGMRVADLFPPIGSPAEPLNSWGGGMAAANIPDLLALVATLSPENRRAVCDLARKLKQPAQD